jgi:hypothetical protein
MPRGSHGKLMANGQKPTDYCTFLLNFDSFLWGRGGVSLDQFQASLNA